MCFTKAQPRPPLPTRGSCGTLLEARAIDSRTRRAPHDMSRVQSPLLGYNNNVRHKNRVFHIQTEDSGVKYGHIITHLFMDGGRILKSVKTSYSEYLANDKMADIVREMMKQQHKSMFMALRDGKYDHLVDGGADVSAQTKALAPEAAKAVIAAAAAPAPAPAPAPSPSPAHVASVANKAPMAVRLTPQPSTASNALAAAALAQPPRVLTPTMVNSVPAVVRGKSIPPMRPVSPSTLNVADQEEAAPSTERTPGQELTLDIDALERAAAAAEGASPMIRPTSELPPPPANLFREKTATGKYRTLPPPGAQSGSASGAQKAPSAPPHAATTSKERDAAAASARVNRYGNTRPASIFGQARPQQGKTIFGEDLISDKSLDEVILSYLADDLEPQPKK